VGSACHDARPARRPLSPGARLGLCGLLLTLLLAPPAPAQQAPNPGQLKQLEAELERSRAQQAELAKAAEQSARELADLKRKLVETGRAVQGAETDLDEIEETVRALADQEAVQKAALEKRRGEVAALLGTLLTLSRTPPEAMLARREAPGDLVRGALLLRGVLPRLDEQAKDLAGQLSSLGALRQQLVRQRAAAARAQGDLSARRAQLEALVAEREKRLEANQAERQRVAARAQGLTREAKDLAALLERVEAERRRQEEERARQAAAERERQAQEAERRRAEQAAQEAQIAALPPAERTGRRMPVAGRIGTRFGEKDSLGIAARGLSIRTRNGATVTSPFAGTVAFAGPFRGYGQILIIDHGDGYHSLLAGFGRIDAAVGREVVAGEPVGTMGEGDAAPDGSAGSPSLYFELRRNGQPVDPLRGLASSGKGRG